MGECTHGQIVPDQNTMGKQALQKAKRERFLVRDFLDYLPVTYLPRSIRSARSKTGGATPSNAGPDVRITCIMGGRKVRIGIEVTEYQSDATEGGSQGRRFDSFFSKIWVSLGRGLAEDAQLRECTGYLSFDGTQTPRPHDAPMVAEELVRLLRLHLRKLGGGARLTLHRAQECLARLARKPYGDRCSFPLLERYFISVRLQRCAGPVSWSYNNAASVGAVEGIVVRLITDKARKLPGYTRTGLDETWLLICAGVGIAHDSAGPAHDGGHALRSQRIHDAAARSGFDSVIFWERAQWHLVLSGVPPDEASSGASDALNCTR